MEFLFPEIELTKDQQLWLNEVYQLYTKGKTVSPQTIWARLVESLPKDFYPYSIPHWLLKDASKITLFGIWFVNANDPLIPLADKVLRYLRSMVIDFFKMNEVEPRQFSISYSDLAVVAGETEETIREVHRLISFLGSYWQPMGHEPNGFDVGGIGPFQQLFKYERIDNLVSEIYEESEKRNRQSYAGGGELDEDEDDNESFDPARDMVVSPLFKPAPSIIDHKFCFVLMPLVEPWSEIVFERMIRKTVMQFDMQCLRSNDFSSLKVMESIWLKINEASLIIADVTGRNPNVMYELGIAHTIGKPTILITQDFERIPFDTNYLRHLKYEFVPGGDEKFVETLTPHVQGIYAEYYGAELYRKALDEGS